MATAAQKMTKARANLVMGQPFFGALSLRLKMIEDKNVKTAIVNGESIRYNPDYVDTLPLSKVQGLIAHCVMHCGFLHHTRRGAREKGKWDKACDQSINTILKNANFDLPDDKHADPKYNGMTAEHIYTLLPEDDGGGKGKGKGQGGAGGQPPPGQGQGQGDPNNETGSGNGDVGDSPQSQAAGGSQSQQNHEEAEWKVAVAQAAHVAKQQGALPGDIERMIDELMEACVDWKAQMQRFMTEKSSDDFSWMRGNRRFLGQGLYLPSRQSQDSMGEIVIVIDVSGSIGQKELNEFGSEIKTIVEEVRPTKTYVLYCDTRIAHVDEFGPDDELEFKPHGGGGTDFRPPFEWMKENDIVPRCFVYLTDGYGPFPEEESDFPVLWCINNHDVVPPHGEHLVMEVS